MNTNPDFAKQKLNDASLAKKRSRGASWAAFIAGLLLLIVLGVALADYQWLLPLWARATGFSILVLLALGGIVRLITLLRRSSSIKEVALDVESRDPKLGCTISTAAEYLSGERQVKHEYEPALVAALETQAGGMLSTVKIPYWRSLIGPISLCVAGSLVFLGFLLCASGSMTALRRTASPWSSASYTQIEVKPGNAEIATGRDFETKSFFRGRPPKDARFLWKEDGSAQWHNAILNKSEDGTYAYLLKGVNQDLAYRVEGGGAASPDYHLEVYDPATVKELAVRIDYPAYTQLKPSAQKTPDITAVRGSTATITIKPNVKLSQARLAIDKSTEVPLIAGSNNTWTATLNIAKDAQFRIELWDEKHRPGVNDRTNHITALPDEPPKVEIVEPGQDMRADATNTIALKVAASDDFGLADIKLVYHKLGGPERSLLLKPTATNGHEVTAVGDLPLQPLGLQTFELVSYYVEARDHNNLDGPGIGKSPVFFIEITDIESNKSKGKKQPPGSKLNLLVIQKQIIADTRALEANAAPEKFSELAVRENDAAGFGKLYLDSMAQNGAVSAAVSLMREAMLDLTNATTALQGRNLATALPPEEHALANFYQILKLVPELDTMPLQPPPPTTRTNKPPSPMVNVVLKAIAKPAAPKPEEQELEEMLQESEQLSQAQASINHLNEAAEGKAKAGSNTTGRKAKADENKTTPPEDKKNDKAGIGPMAKAEAKAQQGQEGENGKDQDAKAEDAKNGQDGKEGKDGKAGQDGKGDKDGKAGQAGKGDQEAKNANAGKGNQPGKNGKNGKAGKGAKGGKGGKAGQGQGGDNKDGKPGEKGDKNGNKPDANKEKNPENDNLEKPDTQMADATEQQEELSKEAEELAEKIERAADKDARLGHGISKAMKSAATSMKAAAQSMKSGDLPGGNIHGSHAVTSLNNVTAMLKQVLENNGQMGDVSNEEYPREYEAAIQDYLKRLSYQE